MTFILNALHEDFSILASDRKARSDGPTTIEMPGVKIHAQGGVTINGYKKIHLTKNNTLAVGFSGNTHDHSYVAKIEDQEDISPSLKIIRDHMEEFLNIDNHREILALGTFMENQGIATYFEPETKSFFSNIYLFSYVHSYTRLYAKPSKGLQLIHAGSGSSRFEQALGLEEIIRFVGSIDSAASINECIEWMRLAYEKVSKLDEDTGSEMVAYVATKEAPTFVEYGK